MKKGEKCILDASIWSCCSIALICSSRSHLSALKEQGKIGPGFGRTLLLIRKGTRMESGEEGGRRKKEEKTNFWRNYVLPFRARSNGEALRKYVWFRESPYNMLSLGRLTTISTQTEGVGYRTTTLRRLLISAVQN